MPEVQRLKKKKNIAKGSKVEIEEDGSLYMQFEGENPTLSKFIENSESVLRIPSFNGQYETIVQEPEIENPVTTVEKTNSYSNHLVEERANVKIDSESFKRNPDDKPCYACRNKQCFIQ